MTERADDIVALLAPILAAVPAEDHPLLVAMLERWAADRYRRWSSGSDDAMTAASLRDCADREDEIARRVQALRDDADDIQAGLAAAYPTLRGDTDGAFAALAIDEQYALQARGERLGAATWRALARAAEGRDDTTSAAVFTSCAGLEEASADVLEKLLA